MKKINEIIDKYRNDEDLYEILEQFSTKNELSNEEEMEFVNKIRDTIINYYLHKYNFKTYSSNEVQDKLLNKISSISDLLIKIKYNNGKVKIYPVRESDENKEKIYNDVIKKIVDYQMENDISVEVVFNKFANIIDNKLNEIKQMLIQNDMEFYYGSIYYIVERSLFIINCIKRIPNNELNLKEIENKMIYYKQKYINPVSASNNNIGFCDVDNEFYVDYDLIESLYKKLIIIEKELSPIVIEQWKKYLTVPCDNDDSYRYISHCFSKGLVDPNLMTKACCFLSTPTIKNVMYGKCGLIYDIDVNSVETMCTTDCGSWIINKDKFIEKGCPVNWQLTKFDGDTFFYECPFNSKLISPSLFENECHEQIKRGTFSYSEIVLNSNAKAIGTFYTEDYLDKEIIKNYAEKNNLSLVKMNFQENKLK